MAARKDSGGDAAFVLFAHVFYEDVWQEMASLIAERVTVPFRLVITTPPGNADPAAIESPFVVSRTVHRYENRGRDILPFLLALDAEEHDFEIGLKLHTKRSPHRADGEAWRRSIIDSLLPPLPGVETIVSAMQQNDHLGLLAPEGLLLPLRDRLNDNRPMIRRMGRAIGEPVTRTDLRDGHFAAGSMFWFRRNALAAFDATRLAAGFADEGAQLDATAAHAVERMFALGSEKRGYVSLPVDAVDASAAITDTGAARRLASSRPLSPYAWQPPAYALFALRLVPFSGWLLRRLPKPIRHLLRRIVK